MLKAIITDDELGAQQLLQGILRDHFSQIQVVDICEDLPSCIRSIQQHKPDVVFLDIEMPQESGLNILKYFEKDKIDFVVVFITAHPQYALQAFRLSAIDYLLKPLSLGELQLTIEKIEREIEHRHILQRMEILKANFDKPRYLCVSNTQGDHYIRLEELILVEADGSYCNLYLNNQEVKVFAKNMKFFEQILNQDLGFLRVHRSYLANLAFVRSLNRINYSMQFKNGKEITVARERFNWIEQTLRQYMQK
jgi:two-component system LytT family response regulator